MNIIGKALHRVEPRCSVEGEISFQGFASTNDLLSVMVNVAHGTKLCTNKPSVGSKRHVAKAEETIANRLKYIGSRLRRIRPRRLAKLMCAALSTYTTTVRLNPMGVEDNGK
jgi:hypothetical protein